MKKEPKVSKHAKQRLKQRCGIRKSSAERYTQMAFERGIRKEHTKGQLRKWLDQKATDDSKQVLTWGDKAYIFSDQNVLITVLQLPAELTRNKSRMILQKAV